MMSDTKEDGFWLTKTVCEYCGGISTRTLHRWRNLKTAPFPAPINPSNGSKAMYRASEVKQWFNSQQTAPQ